MEQVERGRWVLGDIVVHLGAPLGVDGGGNQRGPLGRGELGDFTQAIPEVAEPQGEKGGVKE